MTPDGIEFSRYRRMVITRSLAVAAVGATVGLWAWYPDGMSKVYGFLLGAAVSMLKFLWSSWRTARALNHVELTKKGAAVSSATTYLANYAAIAAALLSASLVPQIDFWGTAVGVFLVNGVIIGSEALSYTWPPARSQE